MAGFAKLSSETWKRIGLLYPEDQREEVSSILTEECGSDLPFLRNCDAIAIERVRFAALKLSDGSLAKLRQAVTLAKTDWRDLLVAADFARDIEAHKSWFPSTPK